MSIDIKVFVKIRPSPRSFLKISNNTITVNHVNLNQTFRFDRIIKSNKVLSNSLNDNKHDSIILMCYGQSGSGKTSTILGNCSCLKCKEVVTHETKNTSKEKGVLHDLLTNLDIKTKNTLFIYNDKIQKEIIFKSTGLNDKSSRGHLVIQLGTLNGSDKDLNNESYRGLNKDSNNESYRGLNKDLNRDSNNESYRGFNKDLNRESNKDSNNESYRELNKESNKDFNGGSNEKTYALIDLAGSENNRKTNHDQISLKESCFINKSLFNLNQCINKIRKNEHVPWRADSLTRKIEEIIFTKKNVQIILLIHLRDDLEHFNETLSTLRFSELSRDLKIKEREIKQKEETVWDRLHRGGRTNLSSEKILTEKKVTLTDKKTESKRVKISERSGKKKRQPLSDITNTVRKSNSDTNLNEINRKLPVRRVENKTKNESENNELENNESKKNEPEKNESKKNEPEKNESNNKPKNYNKPKNHNKPKNYNEPENNESYDQIENFLDLDIQDLLNRKKTKNIDEACGFISSENENHINENLENLSKENDNILLSLQTTTNNLIFSQQYSKALEILRLRKKMGEDTNKQIKQIKKLLSQDSDQIIKTKKKSMTESEMLYIINTGSHMALKQKLPGIGDISANKILEFRKYRRIIRLDELRDVLGMKSYRKMVGNIQK
ncbi:Kinesin-like protein [Pseudoloma neurophilia]|uniref:Kinesin-like protein n=1 Tax=Pseudoloma neurophilia TaxID=146866 RepID=A0A0R0M618_9MICR|nr:Kinesin-like protein [Pseudoloma neurophilia]